MTASCYICEEHRASPLMQNICSCTTRSIHLCCQIELLRRMPTNARCTVCLQQYRNVTIKYRWRLSSTSLLLRTIHTCIIATTSYIVYMCVQCHLQSVSPVMCVNVCEDADCSETQPLCMSFNTLFEVFTIFVLCAAVTSVSLSYIVCTIIRKHRHSLPLYSVERNFHVYDGVDVDTRLLVPAYPGEAYG